MAALGEKVKFALDEARMLVLGSQVLIGFQFHAFFEKRFEELPALVQNLKFASLSLMLLTLLLLILPAAYHRIVEEGEDTEEQHRLTSTVMDFALLPFAVAIGTNVYVTALDVIGPGASVAWGVGAGLITLFFWYGL